MAPHSLSYRHISYWSMKCGTDMWWSTQVGVTHLTNSNEHSKKKKNITLKRGTMTERERKAKRA